MKGKMKKSRRRNSVTKTSISSSMMHKPRHPLVLPLAFLALAGSVGVGYIAVQARVDADPVAVKEHVPVVCCDGEENTEDPTYVSEESVFYRGEGVL